MGVRQDSTVAIDEKTGTTGSTGQVEREGNPAVKNCRESWLFALNGDRLMGFSFTLF
jgi:hypothetical protein